MAHQLQILIAPPPNLTVCETTFVWWRGGVAPFELKGTKNLLLFFGKTVASLTSLTFRALRGLQLSRLLRKTKPANRNSSERSTTLNLQLDGRSIFQLTRLLSFQYWQVERSAFLLFPSPPLHSAGTGANLAIRNRLPTVSLPHPSPTQ